MTTKEPVFKLAVMLKKTQIELDNLKRKKAGHDKELLRLNEIKSHHEKELMASEQQRLQLLQGAIEPQLYMATSEYINRKKEVIGKLEQQITEQRTQIGHLMDEIRALMKMDKSLSASETEFYKQLKLKKHEKNEKQSDELFLTSRYSH